MSAAAGVNRRFLGNYRRAALWETVHQDCTAHVDVGLATISVVGARRSAGFRVGVRDLLEVKRRLQQALDFCEATLE